MTTLTPIAVYAEKMYSPTGTISILVPGSWNGGASTTRGPLLSVSSEKMPLTKVASLEARVVVRLVPPGVRAVRATEGMRKVRSSLLFWGLVVFEMRGESCAQGDLRIGAGDEEFGLDLAEKVEFLDDAGHLV